jgi:hypothetical protein
MKWLVFLSEFFKTSPQVISASASVVSALMAFFIFSVHQEGRKQLELTERPIISMKDQTLESQFFENPPRAIFTLKFEFKNIGKHPAGNIRMKMGWSPKDKLSEFKNTNDVTMANRLDPDGIITLPQAFGVPIEVIKVEEKKGVVIEENNIYIYGFMIYEDEFRINAVYCDEFWLKYQIGTPKVNHCTMQDKITLLPYVISIYGDERKKCKFPFQAYK